MNEKITIPRLKEMKSKGEKIVMLTAYDVTFARLIDLVGVEVILVGDSLGHVIQGFSNTLGVSLEEIIYHTQAVSRGVKRAHIVADMPFLSYQVSPTQAVENAGRLLKQGHAESVKLEGGEEFAETVHRIICAGIPVMGHIGCMPQSVNIMGGYKVQGKTKNQREKILNDALCLEQAGVFSIVLEAIPMNLAAEITERVSIPTIGIGAGPACDGQVLVIYDLLGLTIDFHPKYLKKYEELGSRTQEAVKRFIKEVKQGIFPDIHHSYKGKKEAK
jgi:3-methyl-2-oxobutanoate hydroxymethyltransferase